MNQPANSTSAVRTLLKWVGFSFLLVAVIWVVVIIWWQTTRRVISSYDVVLYLIALPFVILASVAVVRAIQKANKKHATDRLSVQPESSNRDIAALNNAASIEKALKLPILAAWGITSVGDNAGDFVKALGEKRSRPRPDNLLLDAQGFPLPTGRVRNLDIDVIEEKLLHVISKNEMTGIPDIDEWRDAFLRALALLDQVIDQAQNDWPLEFQGIGQTHANQNTGTLRGAPSVRPTDDEPLSLQVKLIISAEFRPYEKQLALAYLLEKMGSFAIAKERLHIEIVPASDDPTALSLMDRFSLHAHRNEEAQALFLLACDSTLCTTVAENWQSTGRMFSKHCPNGLMMGEAAFGVLCVSDKAPQSLMAESPCYVTRISQAKREVSADLPGKPTYVCLTSAVNDALLSAGIPGEKIGTIACDADHRTNRTLECIGAMMNHTPQLDAIENRIAANEACGHMGAASVLGAFVTAVIQAQNAGHPVLLFNVSHFADRAATVILPNLDILATA